MSNVTKIVDYHLERFLRENVPPSGDTINMMVRAPVDLKVQLDVIADFLHLSRNALCIEILEQAAEEAFLRIASDEAPLTNLTINGMTIKEAYAKALEDQRRKGTHDFDYERHIRQAKERGLLPPETEEVLL